MSVKLLQVIHIPGENNNKKPKILGVEAIQQLSVTKKQTNKQNKKQTNKQTNKNTLFQDYYEFLAGPF